MSLLHSHTTLPHIPPRSQYSTTSLDTETNPYWSAMRLALDEMKVKVDPQVFPAATDGRYLRNVAGLPVLGFSPIRNQPSMFKFTSPRVSHSYL